MSDNSSLIVPGVAAIVGLLIGYNFGQDGEKQAVVAETVVAMSEDVTALTETVAAQDAALAAQAEAIAGLSGLSDAMAELSAKTDAIAANAIAQDEALVAIGGELAVVVNRLDNEDASIAMLAGTIVELQDTVASGMSDVSGQLAGMAALPAATAPAADTSAAVEAPAAEAAAAPAPSEADALAAEIGETGLVLGVGRTGAAGDKRVFLSRLGDSTAHVVVVGEGKASISALEGPLTLSNGCSVSLAGIVDGEAYLGVDC